MKIGYKRCRVPAGVFARGFSFARAFAPAAIRGMRWERSLSLATVRGTFGKGDCGSGGHARTWGGESGATYADQGRPYQYQIAALNFACGLRGIPSRSGKGSSGVPLMEMRIGKSLTPIAIISAFAHAGCGMYLLGLAVTPLSILGTW